MGRKRKKLDVKYFPLFLCVIFTVYAVYFFHTGQSNRKNYESVKNSLVSVSAKVDEILTGLSDFDSSATYYVHVSYDYGAKQYKNVLWESTDKNKYSVGDEVNVTINPAEPNKIYVPQSEPGNLFVNATVLFCMAVVSFFYSLTKKKNGNPGHSKSKLRTTGRR